MEGQRNLLLVRLQRGVAHALLNNFHQMGTDPVDVACVRGGRRVHCIEIEVQHACEVVQAGKEECHHAVECVLGPALPVLEEQLEIAFFAAISGLE